MTSTERERRTACRLVFLPRCAEVWINTRVDRSVLGWAKNQSPRCQMRFLGRREISPTRGLHSAHHEFLGRFHVVPCFTKRSLTYLVANARFLCLVKSKKQQQIYAPKSIEDGFFASLRHPHKLLLFLVLVCTA
jgi:hypothetical protein